MIIDATTVLLVSLSPASCPYSKGAKMVDEIACIDLEVARLWNPAIDGNDLKYA